MMKLEFSLLKQATVQKENSYVSLYLLYVVVKIKLWMSNEYVFLVTIVKKFHIVEKWEKR